jgi:RHS repeat-associated protein
MEGHLFKDASTHHRFLITAPEFSVQDFICTGGAAYDANGNTTTKTDSTGTTNYSWDFENRLTSVALPGTEGTVSYHYDPFGRRIEKISPTASSVFAYDDDNLVETVNAAGGVVARYSQGLNVDEPLAELRGTATDYYEADGLGSITSLSDITGALAQTYTYDSFGNTVASSGTLRNYFQYTGREFETETSLYYYRSRYYDPTAGRFLSEDPIGFRGGINKFTYVHNRPLDRLDRFGTQEGDGCVDTTGFQRLVISMMRPVSKAFGITIGIGVGGSIGGGMNVAGGVTSPLGGGFSVGASRQLVVSPDGEAAIATSISPGGAGGAGGIAGPQVSISNAPTPDDLGGPFGQGSFGGGDILGGNVDVNFGPGTTTDKTIVQTTLTLGVAVGGKAGLSAMSKTTIELLCDWH